MKLFYKSIFAFILFVMPFKCLFAQQFAVGASFAYDIVNEKDYYQFGHPFCYTTGMKLFYEDKKILLYFESGILFSYKSFKYSSYDFHPYYRKDGNTPAFHPYESTQIKKAIIVPIAFSIKLINSPIYNIYFLSGADLQFRLNEYTYGTGYYVLDTNLTIDPGPYEFNQTLVPSFENKFMLQYVNVKIGTGVELYLSEHIKTGTEFDIIFTNPVNGNYSLALFAKYYFDEIKKPKKKKE